MGGCCLARSHELMKAVLDGQTSYKDAPEYVQSALSIYVYFRASALLDMPPQKRRREADKYAPEIRDLVRQECKRLLEYRRLGQNDISRQPR